jgi:hypothetical protein
MEIRKKKLFKKNLKINDLEKKGNNKSWTILNNKSDVCQPLKV